MAMYSFSTNCDNNPQTTAGWVMTNTYKTIHEIRRENTRALARQVGSNASFARLIGREPTQISRFIGKNPTVNIGDDLARHIEEKMSVPHGWIDQDWNLEKNLGLTVLNESAAKYAVAEEVPHYTVEQLNAGAATKNTVKCPFKHGPGTFAVTVEGPAMSATYSARQTYPDGSIIFVDPTLEDKVEHMDIVAATLPDSKDAFTFRRLQIEAGQSYLVPINPQFPPMLDRPFNIIGKVIGGLLPH